MSSSTFHFITIQPQLVSAALEFGVLRRGAEIGACRFQVTDLRNFAVDRHGSVDDRPYGGGDGMVMRPEPLAAACAEVGPNARLLIPAPGGKRWSQSIADEMAQETRPIVFICPRFSGVDERFILTHAVEQFSLGDFVLSGGEFAALAFADSIARLLPGVLGHDQSAELDSFSPALGGMLEHPLFTRPPEFGGIKVPEVLLSGDHNRIEQWKNAESIKRTRLLRPDLVP